MAQAATTLTQQLAPVVDRLDQDFEAAVSRLSALLRIPSISTDARYDEQTRAAAAWLAEQLQGIGFEASVRPTAGHPMVVGHHPGPGGDDVPHVLYYGHYDVQPPDPLDLWRSDPFEPAIVDGERGRRIVARGAVDDKGQLMTFVEAFRAWQQVHGTLPIRVTILLEGEEETGSPSLDPFLREHARELTADVCVISDTDMWNVDTPAITYMLRGLVYTEVTLHGPRQDLHSGLFGGAVVNPINALSRMLGELVDEHGKVQVPGFYDDVVELGEEEARQWDGLGFDEAGFLAHAGLKTPAGERGWSTLQRVWARPTCDINGIWGGYTGKGAKTVIPAQASAKVSFRLVAGQDPQKIVDGARQFFERRVPPDCRLEFGQHGASPAIRVSTDSPYLEAARQGLEEIFGARAVLQGCGGSIPVVGSIQSMLGFDSLLIGFGLEDDNVHSPNEKFELRCFERGMKSHAAIMARFAALKKA